MSEEISNKGYIKVVQTGGTAQLYGSKISHQYYIGLEIGCSKGGESMDPFDYRCPEHRPLVSIEMSMLQFAQMMTSIGNGEGVPCTVRQFNGTPLPRYKLPDQKSTLMKYADSIEERDNSHIRSVRDQLKAKLAEGKRPTKAEMDDMIRLLDQADSDRSNLNFIGEQTQRIFEKAVVDAQHQIEAHAMKHVGNNLLPKLIAADQKLLLESNAINCEHANEAPVVCPCSDDCYCKTNSCKDYTDETP